MVFTISMDPTWDSDSCDLDEGLSIPGRIGASSPPAVYSFGDLQDFRDQIKDVVVIAVDFECADHLGKEFGQDFFGKMSEIGIATYDPRQSKTSNGATSNQSLETIAKNITANHIVIDQWKGITERTCPAFFHRQNTKKPSKAPAPHKARPYHCMFARSTIGLSKEQGVERLKDAIRQATVSNLTANERKTGAERQVRIIVWCAEMEEKILSQAGVNLDDLGCDIKMWDFQIWMPFRLRFPNYRTAGETVFASLGVVGALDSEGQSSTILHNATNDTVAEVLAFLRCMMMTQTEWGAWFNEKVDLTPISFDWVDQTIYEHNIAQSPTPKSKGKGRGKPRGEKRYNTREPRKDTATKWESPKTTYTTEPAPLDVNNATSCRSVGQGECPAKSTSSCNNTWDRNDDWADNSHNGWPANISTTDGCDTGNDWVNRSGSGWPDSSSPSSNDSGDLTANFSGWPPEMNDRGSGDASNKFVGWPDDVSDVDDLENTPANASGWPADMDYQGNISTVGSSEHSKTDSNNGNVPSASMSVGRDSEHTSKEWQIVHHSRRGKKKNGDYRKFR